ncbi:MAG: protein kinase [Lysobacteraceae bacterium]
MIEIPGYRVLRPLGRGGMASVHLAMQESVQREVALKIMSPVLAADPQFGDRFLREARIAAKLHHRHVVQVHDVGVHGDHHYIAMEYLSGGPVLKKGQPNRGVGYALRVIREIAGALDYAHLRGVIHRDIKPDNILLREDGGAVLTDFGIARANDGTRMTRTGAIIGTPHYMSPEQARGHTVDGRADLYSLGVLLHELLTGRVPYEAEDSMAVGIMHITAPLPELPPTLAGLQSLLDRMLAKEPDERFQTGDELARCVEKLERDSVGRGGETQVSPAAFRDYRPSPVTVVQGSPPVIRSTDDGYRSEPRLGRLDEVASTPAAPRRSSQRRRRPAITWMLLLVVLGAAAGAAWQFQDQLRALIPESRQVSSLEQAQTALAAGRLENNGQTAGARELFNQVLAVDPDNQAARQGLQQVGDAWRQRLSQALALGDLAAAAHALVRARELGVAEQHLLPLEQQLRQRQTAGTAMNELLDKARQALEAGRLDGGGDSALALFGSALRIDADETRASSGFDDTLKAMLVRAQSLVDGGDAETASALIDRVAEVAPGHLGLPPARMALSALRQQQSGAARRARDEAIAQRLSVASQLLADGKLSAPADDNALQAYRAILRDAPGNEAAQAGLRRVSDALLQQAQRQMADFHFDRANDLLDAAESANPASVAISEARAHLRSLQEKQQAVAARDSGSSVDADRINALLKQAEDAAAAGRLVYPPGQSAYDKYRAVMSLSPRDARAQSGMSRLPALARQRFEDALGASRFSDARGYVDALHTLSPQDRELPNMQKRLGRALFGVAAERLGAGEIEQASRAFDQARELDPGNPEIPSLQARIEQAAGG